MLARFASLQKFKFHPIAARLNSFPSTMCSRQTSTETKASVAAMGPHSLHFKLERYLAASLIPLLPAAYFIQGPIMDYALTATIVLHSHWGIMAVIQDYARPLVVGQRVAALAPYVIYLMSVILFIGLLQFNYKDVGLTKAFEQFFSL